MAVGNAHTNLAHLADVLKQLELQHGLCAHCLLLDYPLAPEHPWPAALVSTISALGFIQQLSIGKVRDSVQGTPQNPKTLPVVLSK